MLPKSLFKIKRVARRAQRKDLIELPVGVVARFGAGTVQEDLFLAFLFRFEHAMRTCDLALAVSIYCFHSGTLRVCFNLHHICHRRMARTGLVIDANHQLGKIIDKLHQSVIRLRADGFRWRAMGRKGVLRDDTMALPATKKP